MFPVRGEAKAKIVPFFSLSPSFPASSCCASFSDRLTQSLVSLSHRPLVPLSPPSSSASHSPLTCLSPVLPFFVMERERERRVANERSDCCWHQIRRSMAEMAVTSLPRTCLLCLCNTRPGAEAATTAELSVSLFMCTIAAGDTGKDVTRSWQEERAGVK